MRSWTTQGSISRQNYIGGHQGGDLASPEGHGGAHLQTVTESKDLHAAAQRARCDGHWHALDAYTALPRMPMPRRTSQRPRTATDVCNLRRRTAGTEILPHREIKRGEDLGAHLGVAEEEPERGEEVEDERNDVGEEDLAAANVHGASSFQRSTSETAKGDRSERAAGRGKQAHGQAHRPSAANSTLRSSGHGGRTEEIGWELRRDGGENGSARAPGGGALI